MCGVVAQVSAGPLPCDLGPALAALGHRGPDGRGTARSACGRAHLGHTRLSLVDLAGGQQPIASEDGAVIAAVNGEFYGDRAIRAELEARGHRFKSQSDSEILVHLYEERGVEALRYLRGEFAFVLWDQRRQRLFGARDRFGIKPLVYAAQGGRVLVASEVKALLALGVHAAWDRGALFQAASLQYLLPGGTLFAGVSMVPPGHFFETDGAAVRVEKYWDLGYPTEVAGIDDDEAAGELRRRLDEAVRLRLRGDVPVACQLSGGIDSASVVASAAEAGPVEAFCVAFGGAYDEAQQAGEIAKFTGAKLHVVEATPARLAGAFVEAVAAGEGLAINGHIAAKRLLTGAIRGAGYKAALTGEGADEVLAGYAHLRADLAGSAEGLLATNGASAGLMLPAGASLPMDAVQERLGFVPTWLRAKGGLGLRVRGLLSDDFLAEFAGVDPARALVDAFDLPGQLSGRGRVEQSLYLWTRLALEGYILKTLGDAQEMAQGVEGRLPFLDHELFEWLRGLPTGQKIRGGVEKHVLRRSQRGRLPAASLAREKHPFVAPPLAGPMVELAHDLLGGGALRGSGLFDSARVERALGSLAGQTGAGQKEMDPAIYWLMSAAVLQGRYGLA